MILEDYICLYAKKQPNKLALSDNNRKVTYAQLHEEVCKQVDILRRKRETDKCPFMVIRATQSVDYIITYFAAHLAGIAFVPLEKDASEDSFNAISHLLSRTKLPDNTADILFTTGTTGKQKGVIISHKAILADGENLFEAHEYKNATAFIICGPLNHIGSLSKIYPTLIAGGTIIVTEGMKDMNAILKIMEDADGLVGTFMVPSSIRMLLQFAKEKLATLSSKIDFIETGAAAISKPDMENLANTLPQTRMYNTYASTETGIITTYNWNVEGGCISGCLGKPMKHSQLIITPNGTIACKGDTIMTGYVEEEQTSQVLRDKTIYTNDCGHIDENGFLHLSARLGDVINCGGYKINPNEVEEATLSIPGIKDCICITFKHPVIGTAPKLLYVKQKDSNLKPRDIALALKTKLQTYQIPASFSEVDKINRTYNGKLDRKSYL